MRANNESLMADDLHEDPGFYLWETIHRELKQNEFGFKASMGEFDRLIKSKMTIQSIRERHRLIDPRCLPMYRENVPWNGCKFVAAVVIHLSSSAEELQSKIISVTTTSRSLGGCTIPSQKTIDSVNHVNTLENYFDKAIQRLDLDGACTVLVISIADVEVQYNPRSKNGRQRPGTFAHMMSMTISPIGVYIYQGYGPIGYTLKEYMDKNAVKFPLSLSEATLFIKNFTKFFCLAHDQGGGWTKDINGLYEDLFDVDLIKIGSMKIGSQFHPYMSVESNVFNLRTVQDNYTRNMPKFNQRKEACMDHLIASGVTPNKHANFDGGIRRSYTPKFADYPINTTSDKVEFDFKYCAYCLYSKSHGVLSICSQCRLVSYCCKEHQKAHWKASHKKICGTQ
jgi:hypothetical protein